ncbi:MAG: macro domain-containing protein [Polyangiaceae bacterium]
MVPELVLVDVDPRVVVAWQATFEDCPEVSIVQGSILERHVDAWVTPTNAKAEMNGGVDAAIRSYLGEKIQTKIRSAVAREPFGTLSLGRALCVKTGRRWPRYVISTPTMHSASENISDRMNVAMACAAALHAARVEQLRGGMLDSVAMPGLGASTGKVPPETCATLMWMAYRLCRDRDFASYADLRQALQAELGELDPTSSQTRRKPGFLGWLASLVS